MVGEVFDDLLAGQLLRGELPAGQGQGEVRHARLEALASDILAGGACFSRKTLAVTGRDLMAVGMPAGRALGAALNLLLNAVIDEKVKNEKEALLQYLFSNESH